MAIITISRGSLSGGQRLAKCAAANLGYRVVSREDLVQEAVRLYGVGEEKLVHGLEHAPRLWDRFRVDRRIYITVARATLCHLIREGDVIYHGFAGHLLLRGVRNLLRIRIIVPMRERIQAACGEHGFTEGAAEAYIKKRDEERVSWTRFLYGIEWGDPALYDLTLNLEHATIETACNLLGDLAGRPEFQWGADCRAQVGDLELAARTHARLLLNPKIGAAAAKLEVKADGGVVTLAGVLPGEGLVAEVLATCRQIPDIKEIESDWMASRVEPV